MQQVVPFPTFGIRPRNQSAPMMPQAQTPAPGMSPGYPSAPQSAAPAPMAAPIPNYRNPNVSYAPTSPGYVGCSAPAPAPAHAWNAPMIGMAAQTARGNAASALSAPMPQAGPAPLGGHASFTDEYGRTIERNFSAPGMYSQNVSGGAPNAPTLSPALSAPSGPSFPGYTPTDVARIGTDRQNYASAQNTRADGLDDLASGSYPGSTAANRTQQQQQATVAADASNESKARANATNAQADSVKTGGDRSKSLESRVKELETLLQRYQSGEQRGAQADARIEQGDQRIGIAQQNAQTRAATTQASGDRADTRESRMQAKDASTAQNRAGQLEQNATRSVHMDRLQAAGEIMHSNPKASLEEALAQADKALGYVGNPATQPSGTKPQASGTYSGQKHPNLKSGMVQTGPDTAIKDGWEYRAEKDQWSPVRKVQ